MRLIPSAPAPTAPTNPLHGFVGAQLMVLFADGDELRPPRQLGSGTIRVTTGFSLSEEDAYLVLPDDIGEELLDILRDADHELLEDALDESLLVTGELHRDAGGRPVLAADFAVPVSRALASDLPYAAAVQLGDGTDALRSLNTLDHVQCTLVSALMDETGLRNVLENQHYVGLTWRSPTDAPGLSPLAPTYGVSRHLGPGRVGLELAVFAEDDEMVALLRPAELLR